MAKYLDLTGLSHYDQKIKQYIAQHGGGGAPLYKHKLGIVFSGSPSYYGYCTIIDNNSTPISNSNKFSRITEAMAGACCDENDTYGIMSYYTDNEEFYEFTLLISGSIIRKTMSSVNSIDDDVSQL